MELSGKVAIVTGAARGIGRGIALRLAALGADVAVADLDLGGAAQYDEVLTASSVKAELEALGRKALEFEGDLCQRTTATALVDRTMDEFGRIDILVNNCGGAFTPVDRSHASVMPDEDLDTMLRVNLYSMVYCCQAAVPVMRKQGGGSIVNMSSRTGLDPARREGRLAPYGISKGGVIQYTRYLAYEVGPAGIRVNCIAPGTIAAARILKLARQRGISTESDLDEIPLRRFGTTDDVAGAVQFFASDLSAYVTGQCLSVCGGTVLTPS